MRAELERTASAFTEYRRQTDATISEMASRILNPPTDDLAGEYGGNRYATYPEQVRALTEKYAATAKWGCLQTGNIIDVRAAFIVGAGLKLRAKEKSTEAKRALEFCQAVLDFNNFQREMLQELSKEGELEGKLLLKLFTVQPEKPVVGPNGTEFPSMVSIRHIPWGSAKYKIETKSDDYMKYTLATWDPGDGSETIKLGAPDFVYKRLGGRVSKPNDTPPKAAKCLTQIEDLDQALRDWREINRIFAAPTPHVETQTAEDAAKMQAQVDKLNWKIKKFFAHTGTFAYASPGMEGVASIEREIITLAKMISGTTGVPVHFLGLPDLMSNRATADNLFELVFAATQKEREIWKGLLAELVDKAIEKYNTASKLTPIKTGLVEIDIPFISREQWERLEKVWLPLYNAGAIPLQVLLSKVPDIDAEAVAQEMEKEKASEFERIKQELKDKEAEQADKQGEGNTDTPPPPPPQGQQRPGNKPPAPGTKPAGQGK